MGWFWSSKTPDEASSAAAASSSSPTQSSPSSSSSQPPPSSPSPSPSPQQDNDADPELQKFMAMLQGSDSGNSLNNEAPFPSPSPSPAPAPAPAAPSKLAAAWKAAWPASQQSTTESPAPTQEEYDPRDRSLAEALLPVDMSCRQAFDLAWACQSPAGQWRAVYRHGGVQPCSALWDDFWFCMRVKGFGEGPLKTEAVRAHYRRKELDKYYRPGVTPSSEDVWQSRTVDEVLPPGAVFQKSFAAVLKRAEASPATMANTAAATATATATDDGREDASQILADAERRQRIRQQMGYS